MPYFHTLKTGGGLGFDASDSGSGWNTGKIGGPRYGVYSLMRPGLMYDELTQAPTWKMWFSHEDTRAFGNCDELSDRYSVMWDEPRQYVPLQELRKCAQWNVNDLFHHESMRQASDYGGPDWFEGSPTNADNDLVEPPKTPSDVVAQMASSGVYTFQSHSDAGTEWQMLRDTKCVEPASDVLGKLRLSGSSEKRCYLNFPAGCTQATVSGKGWIDATYVSDDVRTYT